MSIDNLIYKSVGAAMEVYNHLGPGLLESIYEKAMIYELQSRGLKVTSQAPVEIKYKNVTIGSDLRLDIFVEDKLIIELKSVETLLPVHFKQVRSYMKLLNVSAGVLINFNVSDFKQGYKIIK
ncbi:MAG: GxxExxY protein [Bacteroidaceae bacterium]|nr:GxxExxY protein [Bacteroidaceae bacterium]